ncbi:1-deoxy-D-xylulose-5-phosphate synthase [Paraliobacillus quinghaiensis]|uniref:1-deoxy-D-xylulose-5-phosphate synthase n=1 Tax=Paraliobacillus quinghaiensis TaxID=470815 RepID=A0A917WWU5_9BACI|nr:1-deoxy-D-xylulose-5-phosphate synthase [Paraliobacillus quinghaiensis]GGM40305.1 1-deoxy-D-xylulose-5-phosphate synthase [Paraliobacillus quinghaiensis]
MDLTTIKDPSFLKKLNNEELEVLAYSIREFLIEKLSVNGGHLGANLGVVELTLALHKNFNSPEDKLIFDVGHQSYIHKILTGRAGQFDTLRQYKGLSGFLKMYESKHDVWEAGHSSTSLSAAMGMAIARDLKKEANYIVPLIGDGALTGGMALEALNNIGHEQKNMIVILNDNEMSIANNVGALHNALGRMRSTGKYNKVKDDLEWIVKKIPKVGGKLADALERIKDSMKYSMIPGMLFEEFGFTYYGPVDGHDFTALQKNIQYAKKTEGPVIVHVITKKGKGYYPAESDNKDKWHGVGPYKIESGKKISPTNTPPEWSSVVSGTLEYIAQENKKLAVITPAMIIGSKLENFKEKFPDRLFDVGIAEQHATTLAAGMASQGMKPFLTIYSTFLQRAYDQILHDVCRQNLNVAFGIDRSGLVGADGDTHHGVFDINFLRSLPNIVIMMPRDENECQHLVYTAIKYDNGPIAIRYPRGNVLGISMDDDLHQIEIGTWEVLKDGTDGVILTFGTTIGMALEASDVLRQEGLSIRVINARFIKPVDEEMLHNIFKAKLPIVTVEESVLNGGFGSSILEFAEIHNYSTKSVTRMGIPDVFIEHGKVELLLEQIGLTKKAVIKEIKKLLPTKKQ